MAGSVCIRMPINRGESLFGYLARVAEANGYDRSTWLLPAGQRTWFSSAKWTRGTIEHVARITGLASKEVAIRVYSDVGHENKVFFGERISSSLIDQRGQKGTQKFCPDCLRETGFHSAFFDLVPAQVCPRHACRLTNTCPHCNKKAFWGQPALATCIACGGDLTVIRTESVPVSELRGVTAIAKRFGFPQLHPGLAGENLEVAPELAHLSTGEILELMITLAGYLGHRSNRSSFLNFTAEMRADLHSVLNTSLPFVQRWPEGLFEFLDLYIFKRSQLKTGNYGLNKTFGALYAFLMLQTEEPWLTVKASFSDYVENHWTGSGVPRAGQRFGRISVTETARILGFSQPKIHDLIKRGILRAAQIGSWRGAPIFVEREDLEKIAPDGRKPLRLAEIGQRLGLNRKRQRQFLEAGVITAVLGPQIDGSKVYLFKAAQADEILDDFAKQLIGSAASPSRTRTFAEVLKSQKLRQIPLKSLIDAIRHGRLRPVGRRDDKCGLDAFRFGRQASILVLRELEAAHAAEAGGACQMLPPRRAFAAPSGPNQDSR